MDHHVRTVITKMNEVLFRRRNGMRWALVYEMNEMKVTRQIYNRLHHINRALYLYILLYCQHFIGKLRGCLAELAHCKQMPFCYLHLLNQLQKRVCRSIASKFAISLDPLAYWRHVASLSLLGIVTGIALVYVHLNWLDQFHFLFLVGDPLVSLMGCMVFLPQFLGVKRMSMSAVSMSMPMSVFYVYVYFLCLCLCLWHPRTPLSTI